MRLQTDCGIRKEFRTVTDKMHTGSAQTSSLRDGRARLQTSGIARLSIAKLTIEKLTLATLSVAIATASLISLAPPSNAAPAVSSGAVQNILRGLKSQTEGHTPDIYQVEQQLQGHPTEAAEALVDMLDTADEGVKLRAAKLLERLAGHTDFEISDTSVKTIIGILSASDNAQVESTLLSVLGHIGPKDPTIKQTIIDKIKNSRETQIRKAAIDALATLSREERPINHKESTVILLDVLKNDSAPNIRASAAHAIGRYQDNPELTVPALIASLDDNYLKVRQAAVQALGNYHGRAYAAIPKLLSTLHEESDQSIRSNCTYALRNIDQTNQELLAEFIKLLDDPSMQSNAVSYLAQYGAKAAPAVPKLLKVLDSPDRYQRQQAARTLGAIGPAAKDALPALRAATRDPDRSLVQAATEAISQIELTASANR